MADSGSTPGEDCGCKSTEPIGVLREEILEVFSDSGEKKSARDFQGLQASNNSEGLKQMYHEC